MYPVNELSILNKRIELIEERYDSIKEDINRLSERINDYASPSIFIPQFTLISFLFFLLCSILIFTIDRSFGVESSLFFIFPVSGFLSTVPIIIISSILFSKSYKSALKELILHCTRTSIDVKILNTNFWNGLFLITVREPVKQNEGSRSMSINIDSGEHVETLKSISDLSRRASSNFKD